jgi:hypothetical protein
MKTPSNQSSPASPCSTSGSGQLCAAVAALLWSLCSGIAQGTFTVSFDGPPVLPPGTARLEQYYDESGVWFTPIPGSMYGFVRQGSNPPSFYPDDGTAYLQAGLGSTLMFGFDDGSSFDPVSVDLAEYSAVVRDAVTVHFVGYRQDGTVLTADITTAGIFNGIAPVFQTFSFDPAFSGLVRVEIPTIAWSLDNLTLRRSVPEPGIGALVGVGAAVLGLRRFRRRRQHVSRHSRSSPAASYRHPVVPDAGNGYS